MDKNAIYKIEKNENIAQNVWKMVLTGPEYPYKRPGQFVNIKIDSFYLRRPISVCDWEDEKLVLIYKVLGKGTAALTKKHSGEKLDLLVGLGNGFDLEPLTKAKQQEPTARQQAVLVGGGVGVPPLYGLAKALLAEGMVPKTAFGFRSADDVFYQKEFEALGCEVHVATEDGSAGVKGFVTDILKEMDYSYYFACGPQPMLAAVHKAGGQKGAAGQLSFEERMGCGYGVCMGCTCETLVGNKRICVNGPVFKSEEVSFA